MNALARLDTIRWDVRYALRQILRSPGFTAIAVALLGVGIGTNVALFTVINAIALRPAPGLGSTRGAVRIVPIVMNSRGRLPAFGARGSYPEYLAYRDLKETFSDVATYTEASATLKIGEASTSGTLIFASSAYFSTLRVRMALGGGFPPQYESATDMAPIAVASHYFWKRDLDGAPNVIGRQVTVGNVLVTIIGVAAPTFNGVDFREQPVDLFIPLSLYKVIFPQEPLKLTDPNETDFSYIARLKPGVKVDQADAVVGTVATRMAAARRPSRQQIISTFNNQRISTGRPVPGGERYTAETAPIRAERPSANSELPEIFAVFGSIGLFVLLITCTNVSNMLVGRAMSRRHEMAVRLALGAARPRLIRQLLTESSVLAVLATIFSMLLLYLIMKVIAYYTGFLLPNLNPDRRTIAFAMSVALGTGVFFGLAPALHASKAGVSEVLKSGAGSGMDRKRSRLQGSFVVTQLALTIPALAIAGVAVGFVVSSAASKTGFDESPNVLSVVLDFHSRRYGARQADALATQVKRRVATIPGVSHVAFTSGLPTSGYDMAGWNMRDGVPVRGGGFINPDNPTVLIAQQMRPGFIRVDPDFFKITGIDIRHGRPIDATDIQGALRSIVVSEDLAKHVWPNQNPVGKVVVRGIRRDTAYVVVGMAATVRRPDGPAPTFYGAREQRADSALDARGYVREGEDYVNTYQTTLLVRMDRAAGPMAPAVRAAVAEIDKGINITTIRTLAERRANQLDEMLLVVYAALGAAAVLLGLSSVGIYAIVAHGVAQRTREIGVRIALGARSHQVVLLFVRQGVMLTIIGLAIGLPITIFGIRFLPEIGDLSSNPYSFAGTAVVLVIVAAFAAWLPARKAAGVDPVIALRSE